MFKLNQIVATILTLSLMLCTVSVSAYADGSDIDINIVEQSFEKIPELSEEEIERGIEQALQNKLNSISDPLERAEMERGIRHNLAKINYSNIQARGLGDWWSGWAPDIHIKNKYVAGTIDAIVNGILIATGVGSMAVALKKYGAKELSHMFIKSIKKRVIGKAAIALGISIPSIVNFIMYVTDPAMAVAKYLDSLDSKPNNGYFDVVW